MYKNQRITVGPSMERCCRMSKCDFSYNFVPHFVCWTLPITFLAVASRIGNNRSYLLNRSVTTCHPSNTANKVLKNPPGNGNFLYFPISGSRYFLGALFTAHTWQAPHILTNIPIHSWSVVINPFFADACFAQTPHIPSTVDRQFIPFFQFLCFYIWKNMHRSAYIADEPTTMERLNFSYYIYLLDVTPWYIYYTMAYLNNCRPR